jgi:hypothetical protein
MRKLFSILPNTIHPWSLPELIHNELVSRFQHHLLHWCARSGPEALVIEELRNSDRDMFRRVGLTFDMNSEKDMSTLRKVRKNANIIFSH